jgi:transposase
VCSADAVPSPQHGGGHGARSPITDHRRIVEGIVYRYRTGIPWRDPPREAFGPWRTVWKRRRRWAADGTRDTVLAQLTAQADPIDGIGWTVSVDSTINHARRHATDTVRTRPGRRRTPAPLPDAKNEPVEFRSSVSGTDRKQPGPGPGSDMWCVGF